MSFALGFASGVLLATVAFSMLPEALRLASLPIAVAGFSTGFLAMYAFDLFIHRGQLAGKEAEERPQVERFYTKSKPRGGEVTVLAGGISAEELIEGLSIGVGGGGMLYLTISDLIPDAEERHYQQSSALALASGFILVFILSQFL
jgi:zinc transporter, ZIP family